MLTPMTTLGRPYAHTARRRGYFTRFHAIPVLQSIVVHVLPHHFRR